MDVSLSRAVGPGIEEYGHHTHGMQEGAKRLRLLGSLGAMRAC